MCSVGAYLQDICDKTTHTSKVGRRQKEEFTDEELLVLSKRCGLDNTVTTADDFNLCLHHNAMYLDRYTRNQNKCSDPYGSHKRPIKTAQFEITLKLSIEAEKLPSMSLIPGQRLCKRCYEKIKTDLSSFRPQPEIVLSDQGGGGDDDDDDDDYVPPTHSDQSATTSRSTPSTAAPSTPSASASTPLTAPSTPSASLADSVMQRRELNETLSELGVSPLRMHGIRAESKIAHGKRKMEKVEARQSSSSRDVAFKMARALDVSPEQLQTFDKASEYDRLMGLVKTKISATKDKRHVVQLLTLAPQSWPVHKVALEFKVTRYLVRKSRHLFNTKGVLEVPEKYTGHGITDETKELVQAFYEDDENSRTMPGAKDFVSIARNVHKQKRLLLCNINELYAKFKVENPHIKICRSTFATLRPKWCITVDSSGSHSVCVCVYHQNVKLMLDACKFPTDQHALTEMIVCSRSSHECMSHFEVICSWSLKRSPPNIQMWILMMLEEGQVVVVKKMRKKNRR